MRVMVTGAGGQLGATIVHLFQSSTVAAFTRQQLDISDELAVGRSARDVRPDVVINCAAFNDVDGAEERSVEALLVNAFGVVALARAAADVGAVLVHYSTDFVFDGTSERPYTEADVPQPLSVYGASKLLGEWFAADTPEWYVLRVESLFGGEPARSSVDRIISAIRAGEPVRVFVDRTVTPSYVGDVAEATRALLSARPPVGLYHCVNSGTTTWVGVAEEVARILGVSADLVPVRVADVKFRASRPRYCALSNSKLLDAGIAMPTWQDALARYLSQGDRRRTGLI